MSTTPNPFAPQVQPDQQYDGFGRPIPKKSASGATNPLGMSTDYNDPQGFLSGLLISHLLSPDQLARSKSLVPSIPDPSAIFGPRITPPKVGAADLIMPVIANG